MTEHGGDSRTKSAIQSYDAELQELMWTRTRLICLIGVVVSAAAVPATLYLEGDPVAGPGTYRAWGLSLHAVSFLLGLVLIPVLRGRVSAAWLVVPLLGLNITTILARSALFQPDATPDLGMAILLFMHAAFLPSYRSQIALSVFAVVAAGLVPTVVTAIEPSVAAFWQSDAARTELGRHIPNQILGAVFLGGLSIVASRTLYTLGRSAHRVKRLGSYVVEGKIGSGGMGDVYLARHSMIRRPTAVKVLRSEPGDREALERFEREVQVSAALTHPNTVRVFDFGRAADGTFYYAMEYLLGLDLQQMIDRHGPVDPARTVFIMKQACASLAEAHRHGVVHRDIKPSNVFLTTQGGLHDFVKVLDFGLAKRVTGSDAGLTKAGAVFGTPACFAPEGLMGVEQLDSRADVYTLGCVLYWMLVGEPVFPGINAMEVIMDHVKKTPEPPQGRAIVNVPDSLARIALKCLEKDPRDRYQTCEELLAALDTAPVLPAWNLEKARAWWETHTVEPPALETTDELEIRGRVSRR
ncbi:MAG: serine/threonine protein kinase [Gemmatimonadota bacterium]|nr:serine/threonine protein kinase [Gemmatimonadota bacterium]